MCATSLITEIDRLKASLDGRRPLSAEQVRGRVTVFESEETEYFHESNAIEGNTLTLAETGLAPLGQAIQGTGCGAEAFDFETAFLEH
jgi:hypothetical protein